MRAMRAGAAAALLLAATHLGAEFHITVATARDLAAAIGSDRTITLKAGDYLVSEVAHVANPAVSWDETSYGGEFTITGVQNLTLRSGANARLLASPSSASVLVFVDCHTVAVEGLSAGHLTSEDCSAAVLRFEACSAVSVEGCDLFGSGLVGVEVIECSGVSVSSSTIRECTGGAIWAEQVDGLLVLNVAMTANESWPLISLYGVPEAVFELCMIEGNSGGSLLWADEDSYGVSFPRSIIRGNELEGLLEEGSLEPDLSQTSVFENRLADEAGDDWLLDEDQGYGDPYEGYYDEPDRGYEEGSYENPHESEPALEEEPQE